MSIFLRPQKVCESCGQVWHPSDEAIDTERCPNCGSNTISNEKFSLYTTFLFYIVGLSVLVWMVVNWRDVELPPVVEPIAEVAETLTRSEQQVQLPSIEEELDVNAEPALVTPPQKAESKEPPKDPVLEVESLPPSEPVMEPPVEQKQPKPEVVTPEVPVTESNVTSDTVAFSLWSISELRLRNAYTKVMNDGSAGIELRKKEYLQYVNSRNKKCGELHAQFAKNINSVEKLTFKEGDLAALECHSTENTSELNRLKLMGYDE